MREFHGHRASQQISKGFPKCFRCLPRSIGTSSPLYQNKSKSVWFILLSDGMTYWCRYLFYMPHATISKGIILRLWHSRWNQQVFFEQFQKSLRAYMGDYQMITVFPELSDLWGWSMGKPCVEAFFLFGYVLTASLAGRSQGVYLQLGMFSWW